MAVGYSQEAAQKKLLHYTNQDGATKSSVKRAVNDVIDSVNEDKWVNWAAQFLIDQGYEDQAAHLSAKAAYESSDGNIPKFRKTIKAVPPTSKKLAERKRFSVKAEPVLAGKRYSADEAQRIINTAWGKAGESAEIFKQEIDDVPVKSLQQETTFSATLEGLVAWAKSAFISGTPESTDKQPRITPEYMIWAQDHLVAKGFTEEEAAFVTSSNIRGSRSFEEVTGHIMGTARVGSSGSSSADDPDPMNDKILKSQEMDKSSLVLLGFDPEETPLWSDIKKAYKRLAIQCHPDKNCEADVGREAHLIAEEQFKAIATAKDHLESSETFDRRED